MPNNPQPRRTPTLDGVSLESDTANASSEVRVPELEKYRYWSALNLAIGVIAPVALIAGLVTWLHIAGEAGSPQLENWSQLSQILRWIERSLLPLLVISIVAPFAWRASTQGRAWGIYPVPMLLVITLVLVFWS